MYNNNWYPPHPNHQHHPHHCQCRNQWQHEGYDNTWQTQYPQEPQQMPAWNRRVSIEEAMNIALGEVPGQVVKIELEHEKGILVYEVEIVTEQGVKYEVDVDVNTGGIVNIELD